MSKNISEADLPFGVHYQIHSHNGLNGREREAHVHFHGKCDVKYSLNSGRYIQGSFNSVKKASIDRWVMEHLTELRSEWDAADSPVGGR